MCISKVDFGGENEKYGNGNGNVSAFFIFDDLNCTEKFSRERERDKLKFKREVEEITKNRTSSRNIYL